MYLIILLQKGGKNFMKKLLLILSLISLPLTSAVNSLNISVNGVDPTNDPANNSEGSNTTPMFSSALDSFLTAKYFSYDEIKVVKYNEEKEVSSMYIDVKSSFNTDTLVHEIMKVSRKHPGKKLVICTGGNDEDFPTAIYGVTVNEIDKIRKLSKMQNKGTNKQSKCVIPKSITHNYNKDWEKVVNATVDEINLETGEISKKNINNSNFYYNNVNEMNVSVIYTTVANINAIYDVLFPAEKITKEVTNNEK
jgi:hypothetical protein